MQLVVLQIGVVAFRSVAIRGVGARGDAIRGVAFRGVLYLGYVANRRVALGGAPNISELYENVCSSKNGALGK